MILGILGLIALNIILPWAFFKGAKCESIYDFDFDERKRKEIVNAEENNKGELE